MADNQHDAQQDAIETLQAAGLSFPPDAATVANANVSAAIYAEASADPTAFWAKQARERLTWRTPFTKTLEWNLPFAEWFADGTLNVAENCVDRHVAAGLGEKVAIHWVGEPGDHRTLTYNDLHREVQQAANALKSLGIGQGDRVAIYMPMVPEVAIAMLACARLGAAHSVVFSGFPASALADRINDAEAKVLITADGGYRKGSFFELKTIADEAMEKSPSITASLVYRRRQPGTPGETAMKSGRDHWWQDLVPAQSADCPADPMPAEQLLFLLYTSGTTAKPKGIMHTSAGYLLGASFTHRAVFDIKPDDVYWCAADVGWITGHTYIVYGPLANGATQVMYEGTPDTPAWDRWWEIIEALKVNILYCAPTAIRAFMRQGEEHPKKHDLSSLRLLGSVGEPINPEAWIWYRNVIGGGRTPVVDTWWQTETGSIMISPLPGVTTTKPGSATFAMPGVGADVVDASGARVPLGSGGFLTLTTPWPSMLRGIWGDPARYKETYWSRFPGSYFAGDGARRDEEGYYWLLGRVDDVMNISAHRISTIEVESALVDHHDVAEAAVVGKNDPLTGQAIFAFVILKKGVEASEAFASELRSHVAKQIGAIARPKFLLFVPDLPKTRSGKIMRRLLRDIAEGRALGDVTTLADGNVVETIRSNTGAAEE